MPMLMMQTLLTVTTMLTRPSPVAQQLKVPNRRLPHEIHHAPRIVTLIPM